MARNEGAVVPGTSNGAIWVCTRTNVSTTRGSYITPLRSPNIRSASLSVSLGRYGRSEVRASKQSTTDKIRAPMGISAPARPSGYPVPFQFSWWCRTIGTTGYGNSIADKISAPTLACIFIFSNSAGVNGPGLFRMYSGTANLPMS